MTVKELIEVIKGREDWRDIVSIELYKFVDKKRSFHTDCIEYIDDYSEKYDDFEVEDWSVMDCEEMNQTIYANGCAYAEALYGVDNKMLAIAIKQVKYKVVRFDVETKYGTIREVENTLACQIVERDIVGEFNSLEEARACYNSLKTETLKFSDYCINECKEIEVYEYDEEEDESYFSYADSWYYGEN